MREIVLDTETTGLDPAEGHKIVEIGCVELIDKVITGNFFHIYINPKREMPKRAEEIHGLTDKFLSDKPIFRDVANDFLDFISRDKLVIHNAAFDIKFLDYELENSGFPAIGYNNVVDTLLLARKKFPGAKASLDALCQRFNISLSRREKHGALLDSELLADVYIELMGGAQDTMVFDGNKDVSIKKELFSNKAFREKRTFTVSEKEQQLHSEFMKKIKG